jgi:5-methyltetrahydropteroyltriglutamate--homocysteine methyltransferase
VAAGRQPLVRQRHDRNRPARAHFPPLHLRGQAGTSPVRYIGHDAIGRDVPELVAAVEGRDAQGFIAALGPLSLGAGARNEYYPDEESYMMAVAEVMREEYKAVTDARLVRQVDEPEFATTWMFYPDWSGEDRTAPLSRYLGGRYPAAACGQPPPFPRPAGTRFR